MLEKIVTGHYDFMEKSGKFQEIFMSQHGTIKRFSLIIKKVQEDFFPNIKQISQYLSDKGFDVSNRTIQRDLEQLNWEFGLKISYNRSKNGYFIDEIDKLQFEPFIKFLEIFNTAEQLLESLAHSRETLNCISFETHEDLKGIDFLRPLLLALREKRTVSFEYKTFFNSPAKEFNVFPYLLKEYQGRWYLVACCVNGEKLYIFGLDRMINLKVNTQTFVPIPSLNARQKFKDVIGVSTSDEKKEKVVLSFSKQQGNYVKSLPLHHSQKVLIDNDQECRIELHLKINFELFQKILMHGDMVKVLKPASLAKEIKETLKKALAQY